MGGVKEALAAKFRFISFEGCDFQKLPEGWEKRECPYCGETEIVAFVYETVVGDRYGITCTGCLATVNTGYCQNPAQALNEWNRRAADETADVMGMLDG